MAFNFSKIFAHLDARMRILVLFLVVLLVVLLIYFGTQFLSDNQGGAGSSQVANVPQGLQSIPGGKLTPQYHNALEQANKKNAHKAKESGSSSVPTIILDNQASGGGGANGQCNVICGSEAENVKYSLEDWVKQGKIDPDVANELQQLANHNVSVGDYSDTLNRLVKEGKLTPEQARELLEQYKKQHANALLKDSAQMMDKLIQSGQLPLDAANELLEAQKKGVPVSDYAAMLQRLVQEGKISPEVAQQLLAQYTKQHAREVVNQSIATLQHMMRAGQITPNIAKSLIDLEKRMVPVDEYAQTLHQFVEHNQLTPTVAQKILNEFRTQKASIGPGNTMSQLVQQARQNAFNEISDLLRDQKITKEVADYLMSMINKNITMDQFKKEINILVQHNQLPASIAKLKLADYQAISDLKAQQAKLSQLQANNVPLATYAEELKKAVQLGILTPEEAAKLMQEYKALNPSAMAAIGGSTSDLPQSEASDFDQLKQQIANIDVTGNQGVASDNNSAEMSQFSAARARSLEKAAQEKKQQIDNLTNTMSNQANQLINEVWQSPTMVHREGSFYADLNVNKLNQSSTEKGSTHANGRKVPPSAIPLVKAGNILFAVLDTVVNSDYPDTPVMATIVSGPLKGAKLLGKLNIAKNPAGQLDRLALVFTMMTRSQWLAAKTINAFAIDPDTARTVMASAVDYHYMQRYGAIMAASFMKGYADAVSNSGKQTQDTLIGKNTSNPNLKPKEKIAVGLGEVGRTFSDLLQSYTKIPPTVIVNAGSGLGILFMTDLF